MKKKEQQQHQQLYCTANCIITYFVDERDVKREAAWPAKKINTTRPNDEL